MKLIPFTIFAVTGVSLPIHAAVLSTALDASTFDAITQTGTIGFSPTCIVNYSTTTTAPDQVEIYQDATISIPASFASGTTTTVGFGGLAQVEFQANEILEFTFSQPLVIDSFDTNAWFNAQDSFEYSLDGGAWTSVLANTFGVQTTTVGTTATTFSFRGTPTALSANPNGIFGGFELSFDDANHVVPEPGRTMLVAIGALSLLARRRRS